MSIRPSPRENFFRSINHRWLQENSIPPSESRWGTFLVLNDTLLKELGSISAAAGEKKDAREGTHGQLVGAFYTSGIDMESRNRVGLEPIKPYLSEIDQIKDRQDVMSAVVTLHLSGIRPFFASYAHTDYKNSDMNTFYVAQSGLGMPDKDYYLKEEKAEIKGKYKGHIARMFELAGYTEDQAKEASESVLTIEEKLAKASFSKVELREKDKNYNKFTLKQASESLPDIDWNAYLGGLGLENVPEFIIKQPSFMAEAGKLMQEASLKDIKHYLAFTVLRSTGNIVGEDFAQEKFNFTGKVLQGQKEQKPVWKQVISNMQNGMMAEALSPLYVGEHFDQDDKKRVVKMVDNLKESFAQTLEGTEWMTEGTKRAALGKLKNIKLKIGYPDKWIDISGVAMEPDSYAANNLNLDAFDVRRNLGKVGQPVDRTEWVIAPVIVNAVADQLANEMTFPAAILQPPFFDSSADEAYNYGAIGAVIGHELTHFFDDQGRKFDAAGNMQDWWKKEDETAFKQRAAQFVEYYKKYKADGVPVNAELTLGENIADVGGLTIALGAFEKYMEKEGIDKNELVDGLTAEQRFFVGWARVWAGKVRPEEAERLRISDPHAPGEVRVNAVLSLIPQFADAFGVKPGDKMHTPPEDRPKLW